MENTSTPTSAQPTPATASSTGSFVRLTEAAVVQVKEVARKNNLEGQFLELRVVPSGCSGFGYQLGIIPEARPDDITWEQDGVKIATDEMSKSYLAGTEVDFVSALSGAGFKFVNPNAKSSCGCGNSFSA